MKEAISKDIKEIIKIVIAETVSNLNSNANKELLKIREVAQILRVNTNKVYDLIKAGHITALKLGELKVTRFELERFIREANGKDFSDLDNVKTYNPTAS
ncbi:helix-turn-helix domain-containing protein [Tepidibacter formicigenes]|jgi:excisionase family DNA binding protein|uniref:DNA binding domain-containing protein, excisionase family n=1 Tax=Tepidibacter formicigenes DSM 15518 TaxID=1123349 RepID=A0A1M6SMR0_9FIRM|nr:helix-turn-helix domain-containing protein [Tepidibacter formicigenes]SHK45878.1 DNA binding domain-containing protein, excisionase family [Tepidibacter formicigenes DSM 15518]